MASKVVYKYPWSRNLAVPLTIMLPDDARLVDVGVQKLSDEEGGKTLMLWIEHEDPEDPLRRGGLYPTVFHVFGTGHTIPSMMEYQGTIHEGPFVWHIYREPSR